MFSWPPTRANKGLSDSVIGVRRTIYSACLLPVVALAKNILDYFLLICYNASSNLYLPCYFCEFTIIMTLE